MKISDNIKSVQYTKKLLSKYFYDLFSFALFICIVTEKLLLWNIGMKSDWLSE